MEVSKMARMANKRGRSSPADKQQTCKVCGRSDKLNYNVPDELWKKVVPVKFHNKVVCLECFNGLAFEKNVDYADSLNTLYFAGDQAAFTFQTVEAQDA
jgi:hypothetical protein